jgi:hypothetical protein
MEYSVDELKRRLQSIESNISHWRTTNSQSNPGAVMELRDMRKQRDRVERALIEAMCREKADAKKEAEAEETKSD